MFYRDRTTGTTRERKAVEQLITCFRTLLGSKLTSFCIQTSSFNSLFFSNTVTLSIQAHSTQWNKLREGLYCVVIQWLNDSSLLSNGWRKEFPCSARRNRTYDLRNARYVTRNSCGKKGKRLRRKSFQLLLRQLPSDHHYVISRTVALNVILSFMDVHFPEYFTFVCFWINFSINEKTWVKLYVAFSFP